MKGVTRAKVINVYQKEQKGGVIDFNNTLSNPIKKTRDCNLIIGLRLKSEFLE